MMSDGLFLFIYFAANNSNIALPLASLNKNDGALNILAIACDETTHIMMPMKLERTASF